MPKYNKPIDKPEFWKERIDTAVSPHYSVYVVGEVEWKRINKLHEQAMDAHIDSAERVLDAGCAYGRWANKFPNYVGIDFSHDFIKRAMEQNRDRLFMVANLNDLSVFKDGEFDWGIVVSIKRMVIDNLGEAAWEPMQREIARVCKHVMVLEYEDPENYEVDGVTYTLPK